MEEKLLLIYERFENWFFSFLPNFVSALFILVVGYYFSKILSKYVSRIVIRATKDETLGEFLKNVVFVAVLILTVITALANLGVKTTSIIAVLGTAGLAIALSLKDSLSNLASGILLVVLRHFNKGDTILVGSITGKVDSISLFQTKLTTPDNQIVVLPNSSIVSAPITNVNANATRRMDLIFGIGYTSDLKKAKQVLEEILEEEELILKEPAPIVGVNALNSSSVDLIARFWVRSENYFKANITMQQKVKIRFDAEGIEIPYNKLDINLTQPLEDKS